MSDVEYGTVRRADPFPARWGPAPDEEYRTGWARAHIRAESADSAGAAITRRRAELLRRRYGPGGPDAD